MIFSGKQVFLFLLLDSLILLLQSANGNEDHATPMCSEIRGFAGEYQNQLSIAVSASPAENEAIVLIARAFPLNSGDVAQNWIQINATYRLHVGGLVSSLSDDGGVLVIRDVADGTNIDVNIMRVRKDGPVPFRFWSYHANNPTCHIDVSPSNSFVAPIPIRLSDVVTPMQIYFKSVLPEGVKGLMVDISSTNAVLPLTFQVMSSRTALNGTTHVSGEVFLSNDNVAYFAFTPHISTHTYSIVKVNVVWADIGSDDNINKHSTNDTLFPNATLPNNGNTSSRSHDLINNTTNKTSEKTTNLSTKGKHSSLFVVVLLLFFISFFFVIGSAFNYSFRGLVEFPEMIPFAHFFRTCGDYIALLKSSLRHGGARAGYSELNRGTLSAEDV